MSEFYTYELFFLINSDYRSTKFLTAVKLQVDYDTSYPRKRGFLDVIWKKRGFTWV